MSGNSSTAAAAGTVLASEGKEAPVHDVTFLLVPGDLRVKGNRTTLSAANSYFSALLGREFAESKQDEIKLRDLHCKPFEAIVQMYQRGENKVPNLDEDSFYDYMETAGRLECKEVLEQGMAFVRTTGPSVYLLALQAAERFNHTQLWALVYGALPPDYEAALNVDYLDQVDDKLLVQVLDLQNVWLSSEMSVFKAIVSHLAKRQESAESGQLLQMIKCVRFSALSARQTSLIRQHQLVAQCPLTRDYVQHVLDVQRGQREDPAPGLEKSPRSLTRVPSVIGTISGYKTSDGKTVAEMPYLFGLDIDARKVRPMIALAPLIGEGDKRPNGFRVLAIGRKIVLLTGEFGYGLGQWNKTVWEYDTLADNGQWEQVMDLPEVSRHGGTCVTMDEDSGDFSVFVVGGFGKHRIKLNTAFHVAPAARKVTRLPDTDVETYKAKCCVFNGKLHVLFDGSVRRYDHDRGSWHTLVNVDLDSKETVEDCVATDKHIYLTRKSSYGLYRFDPTSSADKVKVELVAHFLQFGQQLCLVDQVIYMFASDTFSTASSVESYNIVSGKRAKVWFEDVVEWSFCPNSPSGCFCIQTYHKSP